VTIEESGGSEGGEAWNLESESGERLRYQRTVEIERAGDVSKCGQDDF
jgi:hypothetical protein